MCNRWCRGLVLGLIALVPATLPAEPVGVVADHPQVYVVKKGDTLWDIAALFLTDPWLWPEIWEVNPAIADPHLIYPGDRISLVYRDGKPVLRAARGSQELRSSEPIEKLRPSVRSLERREEPIASIPMDAIAPFLSRLRVISKDELEAAPYIVSLGQEHLLAGPGFKVYVRGIEAEDIGTQYIVYRPGKAYRNPDNHQDILGYEAVHVADAVLKRAGDPSTCLLTAGSREVLGGDRLLPAAMDESHPLLIPLPPVTEISGRIIAVVDGVTQIGQYQVIVLSIGTQDGVQPGHVLAVYQRGAKVPDRYGKRQEKVVLPDERAGTVLVFRPFDRVSYALVMSAVRPMHVGDVVKKPS
ncbi:MAG: LysM peptidoglycan-binding domain-containing protein [Gammaproteobacteria bacterium]